MASFDEKVEALRRLRDKRLAKERQAEEKKSQGEENKSEEAARPEEEKEDGKASAQPREPRPDPAGLGGVAEADALFCSGHCHERGLHGCDVDLAAAAEMYQLAAEQGHVVSQWRFGALCETGQGGLVPPDGKEALHWYTLAAEAGNSQAQSSLALLLEEGKDDVPRDETGACRWHRAAAEQGHALSQYCLACLLVEGRGEPRNEADAEQWLRRSAEQGFGPARELLDEIRAKPTAAHGYPGDHEQTVASAEDLGEGLLGLAQRIAAKIGDLDNEEAQAMLDELLADDVFSMKGGRGLAAGREDEDEDRKALDPDLEADSSGPDESSCQNAQGYPKAIA